MRPRGESISSPKSTYVGHVGRQNPQWTQSSMRSFSGGWWASKAGNMWLPLSVERPMPTVCFTAPREAKVSSGRSSGLPAPMLCAAASWFAGVASPRRSVASVASYGLPSWRGSRESLFLSTALDTSHEPARVQNPPGIELLLYAAGDLQAAAYRPPRLDPLLEGRRGLAHDQAAAPPQPDLAQLLDDPGPRLLVGPGEPDVGDAGPGVPGDARRDAQARAGPERRVQYAGQLRRRGGDLDRHPLAAGPRRARGPRLAVRDLPDLPERAEDVGGGLRLGLDARGYPLDEDRDHPRLAVPEKLDGARDGLGVQDRLRRRARRGGVRQLDGHRPGRLGPRVQPEVALGDDAECAQRSRKKLGEVVARDVLDDLAARLGHRPVREDDGDPDDEVPYRPVAVPPRPRGVRGHYPAHRGAFPRLWRVHAEHLVGPGEALLQDAEPFPRLHPSDLVAGDVLDHPVHAGGAEDQVEFPRRVAQSHSGPTAPRRDG